MVKREGEVREHGADGEVEVKEEADGRIRIGVAQMAEMRIGDEGMPVFGDEFETNE